MDDLRRTARSRWSGLGFNGTVAELLLGHPQRGIRQVYDLYRCELEKRAALEKWERALGLIFNPTKQTVVELRPRSMVPGGVLSTGEGIVTIGN